MNVPRTRTRRLLPLLLPGLLGACAPGMSASDVLQGLGDAAEKMAPALLEGQRQLMLLESERQRQKLAELQQESDDLLRKTNETLREADRDRAQRARAQQAAQAQQAGTSAQGQADPATGAPAPAPTASGPIARFDDLLTDDPSGLLGSMAKQVPQLSQPQCVADFGFLRTLGLPTGGPASASYLEKSASTTAAALVAKGRAAGLTPEQNVQELRRSARYASGNLPGIRRGIGQVYTGNDVDAYLRSLNRPGLRLSDQSMLDAQAHGYLIYSLAAIVFWVQAGALEACLREGRTL